MMRSTTGLWLLAAAAMLASASPAAATFTVSVSGGTTVVTQTDADTLILTRAASGELVASDSSGLLIYPPTANLMVRGVGGSSPSSVFVVLDSALPGSLVIDLPGINDVTIRGAAATIGGSLKIRGGDGAQVVRLGGSAEPTTVERSSATGATSSPSTPPGSGSTA